MQYRLDKKSGNKLSVLGLGCMRFPRALGTIDMRKTEAIVMEAIDAGVNYFDTAYIYPGSEEALGLILEKRFVRDEVYLATKMPIVLVKGPDDFDRFFNRELERLRTDHVDYYLMHMITDSAQWNTLKGWGIAAWIAAQKQSGRIRQLGFSFHGAKDEFLAVLNDYDWDFCQIQYNYSDPHFQAGVTGLKAAAERMPVVIMEPLLGGKLATGLPAQAVKLFEKANDTYSPAAWGLRWLWDQPEVSVVLSGMNDPRQLRENIAVADASPPSLLTDADRETYGEVLRVFNASYKIHCTGCGYCMPCKRGVNIPASFAAYNTSFSMGYKSGMQQYTTSTAVFSDRPASPRLCVRCGACEQHCPQHLPIMEHLREVRARMEPLWFRFVINVARKFLGKNNRASNP
ncbi:MAG: aldo/keto reductase [Treponema sp.]|nr:aldo/keto reductase [Treponema sp.]